MSPSQASSCSVSRQFTVGNEPITPLRQAATTSSTPDTQKHRRRDQRQPQAIAKSRERILQPAICFFLRNHCASVAANIGTAKAKDKGGRDDR